MRYSIAIPAFKSLFLYKAIESVLNQTYNDFELIIVNDHSPENLNCIIELFNDDRIKYYINEKNCGAVDVVDNWNICLSYAKGDYFVIMGDDDIMLPDYLEQFNKLITTCPGLNVYHCRSYIIDSESNIIEVTNSCPLKESVYENIFHRIANHREQFISDFVYKTAFLKEKKGFYKMYLAWGSDDITSYIAASEKGIAHIYKPVFCYRRSSSTISSSGSVYWKVKAIFQEDEWLTQFLSSTPTPFTQLDRTYFKNIKAYKDRYIKKKLLATLSLNIVEIKDLFILFSYKRKYHLSFKELMYMITVSPLVK